MKLNKRQQILKGHTPYEFKKQFIMRNNKYLSAHATYIMCVGPFFSKYEKYAITPIFLILEKDKLALHDGGEYIAQGSNIMKE